MRATFGLRSCRQMRHTGRAQPRVTREAAMNDSSNGSSASETTGTATRVVRDLAELKTLVGQELGVSQWVEITQERVNLFAEATGDCQYSHVDPERAKDTFFGGTV